MQTIDNFDEVLCQARLYVRAELELDASGHDWWHIHRVATVARKLAEKCGADPFVTELAAILHDIGDPKLRGPSNEPESAIARRWLEEHKVAPAKVEHICKIIDTMSFKGGAVKGRMETLEGLIVQDADRLDAIGAIGIARTFAYGGSRGRIMYDPDEQPKTYATVEEYRNSQSCTINHFHEKLLLLKDLLNTEPAKQLAEQRHNYMVEFLQQFECEWNGER